MSGTCDATVFLNSLLATLNARRPLRETNSGNMVSIPLSATSGGSARLSFSSRHLHHGVHTFSTVTGTRTSRDDQVRVNVDMTAGASAMADPDPLLAHPTTFKPQVNLQIQVERTTDTKTDLDHMSVEDDGEV